MAVVKRSPKRTANCDLAMDHSRGGMIHFFSERFKTRKRSLVAASSLGKWPLARTARRSLAFSASARSARQPHQRMSKVDDVLERRSQQILLTIVPRLRYRAPQ